MGNKANKYKEAFNILLFSWGGDTPPEAAWSANAFMKLILNTTTIIELEEDFEDDEYKKFISQLDKLKD